MREFRGGGGLPLTTADGAAGGRDSLRFDFPPHLAERLLQISSHSDHTLFVVLMAAFAVLLRRCGGEEGCFVAAPIVRQEGDGHYINTVLIHGLRVDENASFRDLLLQARNVCLEAEEHQNFPLLEMLARSGVPRGEDGRLRWPTALSLENIHDADYLDGLDVQLLFACRRREKELDLTIHFGSAYDRSMVNRLAEILWVLLEGILFRVDEAVGSADCLPPAEREFILHVSTGPERPYDLSKTIHEAFADLARRIPERWALVAADAVKPQVWPSTSEYLLYDDLLYYAMIRDEKRNECYRRAFSRSVRDKVVLDVGTGAEAVLARFCVECGARRVYAVEILEESFRKARECVARMGLDERIVVIHGDAALVDLPEKVDVCVSEIVGNIGGSEGAAVIIDRVRRLLKDGGRMIPGRAVTRVAAVTLPRDVVEEPSFAPVAAPYVEKIFHHVGRPFDLRLCLDNFSREWLISDADVFEDLDFNAPAVLSSRHGIRLTISRNERLQGLALWLELHTDEENRLDVMDGGHCWLPVFVPIFHPGVDVVPGDTITATVTRTLAADGLHPDFRIQGRLEFQRGGVLEFDQALPHQETVFGGSSFHRALFTGTRPRLDATGLGLRRVTYGELDERSTRLALRLRREGMGREAIGAVLMDYSVDMVVGLLAVMKAGGAFLPLDPAHFPASRLQFILEDARPTVVVTRTDLLQKYGLDDLPLHHRAVLLDRPIPECGDCPALPPPRTAAPEDPAYIIYTSGTTGHPKGALVEHRSVMNMLLHCREDLRLRSEHTFLQLFSFSFDGFVCSFFTALLAGGTIVQLPAEAVRDVNTVRRAIAAYRVTNFISVPTFFQALMTAITPAEAASLQTVSIAGDRILPTLVAAAAEKNRAMEVVNKYGVTEAAVMSSSFRHQEECGQVRIGRPIANTRLWVVNAHDRLQPVGVAGELCIAGVGVARRYLNNEELTHKKFRPMPHLDPGRVYRTGDLARWHWDGQLEFLGRNDNQVKVRGFRIELEEIEKRLVRHERIYDAAVVLRRDAGGEDVLCAFYALRSAVDGTMADVAVEELRTFLGAELPVYMIPAHFVRLGELPLTAIGKIDRKRLPEIGENRPNLEAAFVEPQSDLEITLARIWREVLGVERVGVRDNFFDLGGNSMKLIQVNARLNEEIHVDVPVVQLFEYPTVEALSAFLSGTNGGESAEPVVAPAQNAEVKDRLRRMMRSENA